MSESRHPDQLRCPVCGVGVLADIAYDEDPTTREPIQRAESREMVAFTCGHEVASMSLAEARRDDPNVERRTAEETVPPVET
jgi:hypothetical protein